MLASWQAYELTLAVASLLQKFTINGTPIPWSELLHHLGITFTTGSVFRCDLHNKKAKYFGSINGVFSKIGNHASPYVTTHQLMLCLKYI